MLLTARLQQVRQLTPAHVTAKGKTTGLAFQDDKLIVAIPQAGSVSVSADRAQRKLASELKARFGFAEDELQILLLLKQFLNSDASDKLQALQKAEAKGRDEGKDLKEELFDAFSVFYFDERINLLRCLGALLRIEQIEDHLFAGPARAFLQSLAPDASFGIDCLTLLEDNLINAEMPAQIRESTRHSTFWAIESLREQAELIEVVFLLYYEHSTPTAQVALRGLEVAHNTDFGRRQANASFLGSPEAQALLRTISSLLMLVCTESLSLESILDPEAEEGVLDHEHATGASSLASSPDILEKALDVIEGLRPDVLWGPLLLGWSLLLNRIERALEDQRKEGELPKQYRTLAQVVNLDGQDVSIWTKLANGAFSKAMQLNLTISEILAHLSSSSPSPVAAPSSFAYRAVFKGLLLSETELVRPEFIGDLDALLGAWERTFGTVAIWDETAREGAALLCEQFWTQDLRSETRAAVLRMATQRWPLMFRPQLRLLKALSGCHTSQNQSSASAFQCRAATTSAQFVLSYFGKLKTIASQLPLQQAVGNAYEVIETDDASVVYRLVRPLPIFGTRAILPVGSIGRVVSEAGQTPVTVIWELERPFSGWRLLRDVLASFVSMLDTLGENSNPDESNVFAKAKESGPVTFGELTPENSEQEQVAAVIDSLELFSALLSSGQSVALPLLKHLHGHDLEMEEEMETENDVAPGLAVIVMALLNKSLASARIDTRLVSAAFTVLGQLLEVTPSRLWVALRPSNVLIGSTGLLSLRRGDSGIQSALLAQETQLGEYHATLALLDFQTALFLEAQQSQFSSPSSLTEVKGWVVTRALTWIVEFVWSDCLNWRYRNPDQKMEILQKCIRLFNAMLSDRALRQPASPLADIAQTLERAFITRPSTTTLAPLAAILASSTSLVQEGARGESSQLAQLAPSVLRATYTFCARLVQRRRELNADTAPPQKPAVGPVEALVFDHTFVTQHLAKNGGRDLPKVQIAAQLFDSIIELQSTEAASLITLATCSAADVAAQLGRPSPALIGSLGTLPEIDSRFAAVLDLARSSPAASSIWNMLAALAQSQPALAALLITGQHLNESGKAVDSNVPFATALRVAVEMVESWKQTWATDVSAQENAIKFLDVIAAKAREYPAAFSFMDEREQLWKAVRELITIDDMDRLSEDDKPQHALRLAFKARALRLLGTCIANLKREKAAGILLDIFLASDTLVDVLSRASRISVDEGILLLSDDGLKSLAPSLPLESLRKAPISDDFDLARQLGDTYVIDLSLLASKLVGLQSPDPDNLRPGDGLDLYGAQAVGQLVMLVNREWSRLDAQIIYLRAWTDLISRAMGPMLRQASRDNHKLRASAFKAWLATSSSAITDVGDKNLHVGRQKARFALLSTLLELAWGQTQNIDKANVSSVVSAMENVSKLLEANRSLLDGSLKRLQTDEPHQHMFRIILLATLRYRELIEAQADRKLLDAKQHRDVHRYVDTFAEFIVCSLRVRADSAAIAIQRLSEDSLRTLEEDIAVLCSILDVLVRPEVDLAPHFLAATFQASSLLPACVDLFVAAPQNASSTIAVSVLSLFLTLATHPSLSELLVLSGLMVALSNNASTAALEAGAVVSRSSGGEHNPQHQCWLVMLRIVASLCVCFGETLQSAASQTFVETEVASFVRLYQAQIEKALSMSPVSFVATELSGMFDEEERFSYEADLEEVEAVVYLLVAVTGSDALDNSVINRFALRAANLLQQMTYLLGRPHLLARTFGADAPEEASDAEKKAASAAKTAVIERAEIVAASCVALLSNVTQAAQVICADPKEISTEAPIVTPVSISYARATRDPCADQTFLAARAGLSI